MNHSRKQPAFVRGNHTLRSRTNEHRDARIKLRFELLESRHLLAGDLLLDNPSTLQPISQANAPITWFERFDNVSRVALESLATVDRPLPADVAGPQELAVGEWIVQLNEAAIEDVVRIGDAEELIRNATTTVEFKLISGLGSEGLLLVRGQGATRAEIEASLANNGKVERSSLNQLIRGEDITPNDTDFAIGRMASLELIGLPSAWEETIGDLNTVVGVLDTGLDLDHRDIYLNVWFNQGEIPDRFYDAEGTLLLHDIDDDGLITFYDLNHATRSTTAPFELTVAGFMNGLNAEFVEDLDLNGNGYIDALDILASPLWADGRDTDGNGEVDDFFGVNFRDGVRNNPNDGQGHGTHVAGTIGAIGGNGIGVTGINWQTSLMPLRILDNSNQGDTGSAIRAVNYAKNMRERYRVGDDGRVVSGANVRVLNNSWGQPGGEEAALESAITESGTAGILFVAASGNGNFLGQGVNNDRTPFYPASYISPNIITVAASTLDDRLAPFSNFGMNSVDIAAPGVGILSTERGGGFGSRNGTSMSTPHVSGAAALIWSALPAATVGEVRAAIITSAAEVTALDNFVATGGRLDASGAIFAEVFAPSARLVTAENITTAGGTTAEFTVEYSHRSGIDISTVDSDELVVTRTWGPKDEFNATLQTQIILDEGRKVRATYVIDATGGSWDAADYGGYAISTKTGSIKSETGSAIGTGIIGEFFIQIEDGITFHVDSAQDESDNLIGDGICLTASGFCTIRAAIDEANRLANWSVVILTLKDQNYQISQNHIDIDSFVSIIGDSKESSQILGNGTTRIFVVAESAFLSLDRVTLSGGRTTANGGSINTSGQLRITDSLIANSVADALGGAISGQKTAEITITRTTIEQNTANLSGGGVSLQDNAILHLWESTLSANSAGNGGAIYISDEVGLGLIDGTQLSDNLLIENSTLSGNVATGVEGDGYAVHNSSIRPILINHTTVVDNRGFAFGTVIKGWAEVSNSIFANELSFLSSELDIAVSRGNNLIADTSLLPAQAGDIFSPGARRHIGQLDNNGGGTKTHQPLPTSLAIDNAASDGVLFDQNGNSRDRSLQGGLAPDIGAVEVLKSVAAGRAFLDRNRNGIQEGNEEFLTGEHIFADVISNGLPDEDEVRTVTTDDDPKTTTFSEEGLFNLKLDFPASHYIYANPRPGWRSSFPLRESIDSTIDGGLPNGLSQTPSITANARFIAYSSEASNLVSNDFNGNVRDVFVYDRQKRETILVSAGIDGIGANGPSRDAKITADGRFIVFSSFATNLTQVADVNESEDIFVYDRKTRTTNRVSISNSGIDPNSHSFSPSISSDGRFVAFASQATNLIPGDVNGVSDIFVFDQETQSVQAISVSSIGDASNGQNSAPSVSSDGRLIAFASEASNLVPEDNNDASDVFVFDLGTFSIARVSINDLGEEGNSSSFAPFVGADGRFVTFLSRADNLTAGINNLATNAYVYDRQVGTLSRIGISSFGEEPNSDIEPVAVPISSDGRTIVFASRASNLDPGQPDGGFFAFDRSLLLLQFIAPYSENAEVSISGDARFITFYNLTDNSSELLALPNTISPIVAAQVVEFDSADSDTSLSFGLVPDDGQLEGHVFLDTAVLNGVYDFGEEVLSNHLVYLDTNGNGLLDSDEPRTFTDTEGRYHLEDVPAFRNQVIVVAAPNGFEQVVPEREDQPGFTVFLPAGGNLNGIDFGFRTITTTGQSSDSTIRGRVMIDSNGNGVIDEGDAPAANRVVYMDAGVFGVRDFNDPQAVTDVNGVYEFTGLPATITPLRLLLDETLEQTSPVGSSFELEKFPLQDIEKREGNPQAVVTGLFNDDAFPDVAVLLAETNTLSIRLNDGSGGFLPQKLDVNLSDLVSRRVGAQQRFLQPTSIVTGDFDGIAGIDVAITGNFSRNVLVLRNFDVEGFDPEQGEFGFSDEQLIETGDEPLDIVAGQFAGDAATDLVVLNKGDNTVRILTNNGSGMFTANAPINTGGFNAASLTAADFTRDGNLDIAVTHSVTSLTDVTAGRVTVLVGDGNGGLVLSPSSYTVQAGAVDSAVGDFDGDDHPDLAVVNLQSQSISVLLNEPNGTLRVQLATLGTTQGAVDIAVADIDNDGDDDILATKLQRREIAIFRNIGVDAATGNVRFEPQESIGVGQFSFAERAPFVLANLDRDKSGPNGTGTIDVIAVPQNTDTLFVLKNTLVQGSRRAAVSGARTDIASDVDFLIRPAILPPSFTFEALPIPNVEDALEQTVALQNITKGRETGPPLQFSATSSNTALIASATVTIVDGTNRAIVHYTPLKDANGTTGITVRAVDAGADATFDTSDDGIFERSFAVTVLAANDPPVFNLLTEAAVKQTDGVTTVPNFVTGAGNGGGVDENSQMREPLVVTATDPSFFTTPPSIDAAGTLTFTPNPNKSGSVPVTVTLKDSGGRANGGVDTTTKTFVINVLPVNDPPSLTLVPNPNRSVVLTAGPQTVNNFVASFLPGGGPDEASQMISDYIVTVDVPGIFAVLPDISNTGTLTFTPAIDRTGLATVSVQARDDGGRVNGGNDLSTVQSFTITVTPVPDTSSPLPQLSANVPAVTNQPTFDVNVDFGEVVTGFNIDDVTLSTGLKSNLIDNGNGRFTLRVASTDGPVTISIPANVATDLSGNQNLVSNLLQRTIDLVAPSLSVTSTAANPTNASNLDVAVNFDEPVVGFALTDITVIGGTASNLTTVNSATGSFNVTITPTSDGSLTVLLPSGIATDVAGNPNTAATPLTRSVDRLAPSALLTTDQPARTNRTNFDVFVDFGEVVTGLTASDLTITGGTAAEPVLLSGGRYSFTISATNGPVSMSVAAGAVLDAAGNASTASNTLALTVDTSALVPAISSTSPNVLNTDTFDVNVAFGKQVTGFELNDVTVINGSVSNLRTVDAGSGLFLLTVTAANEGNVVVLVPANAVTDQSGNPNAASNTLSRNLDRNRPTPTLLSSPTTSPGSFSIAVSFNESVTGLAMSDFQTTNATVSQLSGSGANYTVILSAIADGQFSLVLPEQSVADLAGNANVNSNVVSLTHTGTQTPTSIVLSGGNETVDMATQPDALLSTVTTIDIRGTGRNTLVLDAAKIESLTPNRTLLVIADQGDLIDFGDGWQFDSVEAVDGRLQRVFTNGAATVRVIGPLDWTNPNIAGDVNGSGSVTAADALEVIVALNQTELFTPDGKLVDATTISSALFRFLDANEDGACTAADALFVINILVAQPRNASAESESLPVPSALFLTHSVDQTDVDEQNVDVVAVVSVPTKTVAFESSSSVGRQLTPVVADSADDSLPTTADEIGDFDATLAIVWNWIDHT